MMASLVRAFDCGVLNLNREAIQEKVGPFQSLLPLSATLFYVRGHRLDRRDEFRVSADNEDRPLSRDRHFCERIAPIWTKEGVILVRRMSGKKGVKWVGVLHSN